MAGAIRQIPMDEKYHEEFLTKISNLIANSKLSDTTKAHYKDSLERLVLKENRVEPLIIKNEVECRNCKNILLYINKYKDLDRTIYDSVRCPKCGQRQNWDQVRRKIINIRSQIEKEK